jgi:predicted RNA binding protein YcfA (HicA-like mRNA interferase family)
MSVKLGKEIQAVVKSARTLGFTWSGRLTGGGHVRLKHENGGIVILPATPSRPSWRKNAEADLRKVAGGSHSPRMAGKNA